MGNAAFERFIAGVEELVTLNETAAREAAPDVLRALQETSNAGSSPSGSPWPARADGGRALSGAAAAITIETRGNRVVARIGPPWVFHNHGAGGSSTTKGAKARRAHTMRQKRAAESAGQAVAASKFHAPKRQIIPGPDEPMPEGVRAAVAKAAAEVFKRAMGGT